MKVANPNEPGAIALRNKLVPSGSLPNCVSSTGVYDMSGNIDEFVINESGRPYKSSLVGGHILGVRNKSRPSTDGHNEYFKWYETGTRLCADIEK
jgi:sulfatase modifying factor 1